jgi:hypothetical protein
MVLWLSLYYGTVAHIYVAVFVLYNGRRSWPEGEGEANREGEPSPLEEKEVPHKDCGGPLLLLASAFGGTALILS